MNFKDEKKLALKGDADAQYTLGWLYYNGYFGFKKDKEESLKWYKRAANQGLYDAQTKLGCMYANGYGVDKDYDESRKWYKRSADNRNLRLNAHFLTKKK